MECKKNLVQLHNRWKQSSALFLSAVFCIGLVLGVYFAVGYKNAFVTLLSDLRFSSVSIAGLCICAFAPLFLSFIFVLFSCPVALLPLCFCKAFSFAYCSSCCFLNFGNAGWLIRFLFLFSDTCSLLPLLWFGLRHIDGSLNLVKRDFIICNAFLLLICSLDYFCISPFFMMLINY